jgi:hypothetical protein
VYLILDEFILGGEFEETSKKVRKPPAHAPGCCRVHSSSVQCCAAAAARACCGGGVVENSTRIQK